jgi:hypothetical protein
LAVINQNPCTWPHLFEVLSHFFILNDYLNKQRNFV